MCERLCLDIETHKSGPIRKNILKHKFLSKYSGSLSPLLGGSYATSETYSYELLAYKIVETTTEFSECYWSSFTGRNWRKLEFRCGSATDGLVSGNNWTASSWTLSIPCPYSRLSLHSTQFRTRPPISTLRVSKPLHRTSENVTTLQPSTLPLSPSFGYNGARLQHVQ
jgi:hypothetical protein